ncbi:MAG: nuclease-related domain-containing protein [Acetobacteraceae bacterium]|nr:nuclease-related domain-containing protein [Acetobacteraceae bacterium]
MTHPTNSSFDLSDWKSVIATVGKEKLLERDVTLIRAAVLIGMQNAVLRQNYTSELFTGFTSEQIAILAIAHANRGFLLIREKAHTAVKEAAEAAALEGRPLDTGALSQITIQAAEGISAATADDINATMIDTLPHWFALAAKPPAGVRPPGENLGGVAQRAGAILSLEHCFRDVWQQVLWEPWIIANISEVDYAMVSTAPDWQIGWRAWDLRQQTLHVQGAMLNRQFERIFPNAQPAPALPLTVTGIDLTTSPPVLTIAPPLESQAISHRMALDGLDDCYTRPFAEQEVGEPSVTSRLLSRAVLVLQDLISLMLPRDYDPEDPDWSAMERLACALPRVTVVEALARSLSLDPAIAGACVTLLTSDTANGLGEMFRIGVWHRPLIAMPGGTRVLIVAGALLWGSPVRRAERWLQSKNGDDMSKTPNGLLYEAHVRARIRDTLSRNDVIAPQDRAVSHLPQGRGKEEIDLLVRIGGLVLVGEIKCLLGPSEPSEYYNYLRKLEKACEQARRKAAWLEGEQALAQQLLGGTSPLKMLPLVIVNQSNGVGLVFDGCQVTDAHFLRIVLSGGEYNSGAKFKAEASIQFYTVTLYSSVGEAEAILPNVFADHLGVRRYRDAAEWNTFRIPLAGDNGELMIFYPVVDEMKYRATWPLAADNDGASAAEESREDD